MASNKVYNMYRKIIKGVFKEVLEPHGFQWKNPNLKTPWDVFKRKTSKGFTFEFGFQKELSGSWAECYLFRVSSGCSLPDAMKKIGIQLAEKNYPSELRHLWAASGGLFKITSETTADELDEMKEYISKFITDTLFPAWDKLEQDKTCLKLAKDALKGVSSEKRKIESEYKQSLKRLEKKSTQIQSYIDSFGSK